jgi:HD-like signal output (HDOD) protein
VTRENSLLDIVQAYLKSDRAVLPVFNRTGLRVQQEAAREEPDLRVMEKLIVSDQSLTTQVLRTANSSFYSGLKKAGTIREAILRLGTTEVANLVSLAAQREGFRSGDPLVGGLMVRLWRHAVGCAIGSQWLALQLNFVALAAEAFTAGLLHDVGKLLLLKVIALVRRAERAGASVSDAFVHEILDTLHAEQGYLLTQRWNLPEAYCHVVRAHHDAEFNTNDTLLILVRMADKACNKLGIGLRTDPALSLETTPEANLLGLNEVSLARLEIKLEDSLQLSK